jgi:uncharacterized membrane protein
MSDATSKLADANPFKFGGGGSMFGGSFAQIMIVVAIVVVILLLAGFLVWYFQIKKKYWIKIHLFRIIGNVPTRVAIHEATEVPFGRAGDRLWKVCGKGFFAKLKPIKWLPVGKIQSAPKEFWYYIREDGEWINFQMDDLNEVSKKAGVKFTNEDMRLQRLATERLLEQRLMEKTFWEKWQNTIMTVIFFLVIAVCMVLIFYQFSKLLDQLSPIIQRQAEITEMIVRECGSGFLKDGTTGVGDLVPVS